MSISFPGLIFLSIFTLFSAIFSQFYILKFIFLFSFVNHIFVSFVLNLFFFHSILFLSKRRNVFLNLSKPIRISLKSSVLHIISFILESVFSVYLSWSVSYIRDLFECMGIFDFCSYFRVRQIPWLGVMIYIVVDQLSKKQNFDWVFSFFSFVCHWHAYCI